MNPPTSASFTQIPSSERRFATVDSEVEVSEPRLVLDGKGSGLSARW